MNQYTVDVLAYRLEGALYGATWIDMVVSPTKLEVLDVAYLSPGDAITITLAAGGTASTVIQSITGMELTVAPAVAAAAAKDEVRRNSKLVTHTLYTYKALDPATGEAPQFKRPFIAVMIGGQPPGFVAEKANVYQQPVIDKTGAAIYIESRKVVDVAGKQVGGFDYEHVPAVLLVRHFIETLPSLRIPAALHSSYRTGWVSMVADNPPERYYRHRDHERSVFYVVLGDMKSKEASHAT